MRLVVPQTKLVVNQRYVDLCDVKYCYTTFENGVAVVKEDKNVVETIKSIDKDPITIYCHTDRVLMLLKILKDMDKKFILFTGCSDSSVHRYHLLKKPDNIVKWFAENTLYNDPNLIPTPIGSLAATWIGNYKIPLDLIGHKDYKVMKTNSKAKKIKNLVLMAFSLNTNPIRRVMYERFKDKAFVTNYCSTDGTKVLDEREFAKAIYSHEFVLSPEGNGVELG